MTTGQPLAVDTLTSGWQPPRVTVALPRLLRAELRWIFRRPRTLIVLGLLAAIPVVIGISVRLAGTPAGGPPGGEAPVFVTAASSALALPIGAITVALALLLPLSIAMVSGDALAGEHSHGTLRGWLLAPVGRGRLLAVKAFGVAMVAITAVTLMSATGLITGLILNGTDGLFTLSGTTLSFGDALLRVALAAGWVAVQLCAVGAVALAISASTEHPVVVVACVLAGDIVFGVLQLLSAVAWLHPFLLTDSWSAVTDVLRDPLPTDALAEGALRALCYIAIGLSLAYARVTTRDG
ncbi:MAG: ABC transporter permease [Haloechinothrix sp.]